MGKINILDKFTAEKISAGEVVQRPASVIKELVENAIDAGATTVTVEIRDGGTSYMRVTDNGSGMDKDDASKAFLRHATSKIKTDKDLCSITTLGFRGEALCSIGAVSRTEIFTKQRTDSLGTHILVEGGEEISLEGAGCPDGTTVVVRNLFFNTPARLKFLKKDSQEAGAIADVLNKQALGNPGVSIRFIRDGKEALFSPGDNILENALRSVFGKDISNNTAPVSYEKNGIKISGLIGKNNLSRPNRLMQIFFVNQRYVLNKTLSVALSEAYKNELMGGRFPVAVLNIDISPSLVDANVHPEKTEIKFADEGEIYETLYWAIRDALARTGAPREVLGVKPQNAFKMPVTPKEVTQIKISSVSPKKPLFTPFTPAIEKKAQIPTLNEIKEAVKPYEGKLPVKDIEKTEASIKTIPAEKPPVKEDEKAVAPSPLDIRVIGQLFSTYILAEGDEEFFLMDQHAAHERIRYEKIRQSGYKTDAQLLLMPLSVNLTPTEKALFIEKSQFLNDLGFDGEDFGTNAVMLRSLPADCIYEEGADVFVEILNILSGEEKGEITDLRDKAIYSLACHSAVRANQTLSQKELEKLFFDALKLEGITTCPHGRPITVKLTKYQIEKMFGRII